MRIILLLLTIFLSTKVLTKSINQIDESLDEISQLDKRDTSCSSLYTQGRCSADCPCQGVGECCSEYGYCGTTEDYCGNKLTNEEKEETITTPTTIENFSSMTNFTSSAGAAGIVVFLPNYQLNSSINLLNFDFSHINVVIYSFFGLSSNGEAYSLNEYIDFTQKNIYYLNNNVKKKYPNLRTILSFGGGTDSTNFGSILSTNESIKTVANSITKVMSDNGFDGVDIDWEFPDNETECANLAALLKLIREIIGSNKLLTISASTSSKKYKGYSKKYIQYVNWFNVMTYNYAGGWNTYTGYNSPLYAPLYDLNQQKSCETSLKTYNNEGIPNYKLVLGAAFYGQAWKVISSTNNGYNQEGTTSTEGEYSSEDGIWTYRGLRKKKILSSYNSAVYPWIRTWHNDVKSPTLFNPKTMQYISYDDPDSMCERVYYVKKKKLAGFMMWEIGQDYKRELLDTIINCYGKN